MSSSIRASTTVTSEKTEAPRWAQRVRAVTDYLTNDFLGGPRHVKFAWPIDFQKAGTFVLYGFLLWYYHQQSTAAWVYVAMHGSYGLIWIIKDLAFPDPSWQRKITVGGAVNAFLFVLGWYWLFGWLLISRVSPPHYPLADHVWFCLCISICMVGSAIMIAADSQKYFTLRQRRGLITGGMFRFIRHPNYLGEMFGLHKLRNDGLAVVAGFGACLGMERRVRRQYDHEGSEHVTLPRMASLSGTHRLASAEVR